MKTALVAVAGGPAYQRYAEDLMDSAAQHFQPTEEVSFNIIPGDASWPAGTMMRWHRLLEHMPDADFVYLIDADMLMVARVGTGILPPNGHGITATQHPGYVGVMPGGLPFDRNLISKAFVRFGEGSIYHCGGFVGGERSAVRALALRISEMVDGTLAEGSVPLWHDESCLNRCLIDTPPNRLLSPAYCYPQADGYYKTFWPEVYIPRIVALDKTQEERGER